MTRNEVRQIVWQEIRRTLNIVMTGNSQNADGQNENVQSMLAGAATTDPLPVAYPWGFASRTPDSTAQLVLQMGNSINAKVVASHFDPNRPILNQGESCLYNQFGQVIYLENGAVKIGALNAAHPYVLGDILQTCLEIVFTALASHTHIDSVGGVTQPPNNASVYSGQASSPIGDGTVLSKEIFGV